MTRGYVVKVRTVTGRQRPIAEDREQNTEREAERQARREARRAKDERWAFEVGLDDRCRSLAS